MAVRHLRLHWEYLKVALSTAMEYKVNFIIQVLSMTLNDVAWLAFWWIFFARFKDVNGWVMGDMMLLYAIVTIAFGLASFLFGHMNQIAILIAEGRLDFYMTLPKNRLYHVLISRSNFYALGDVLFGVIVAAFVVELSQVPLFIILTITSMMTILAFGIIVNTLAFYMGNAEGASKHMFWGAITVATYPFSMFKGMARIIILSIVPIGFISGVPVELLKGFTFGWFAATVGFAFLLLGIAVGLFYHGIRRYESGNLLYVRM